MNWRIKVKVSFTATSFKEQRMWILCASLLKLKANKAEAILVQFPPYLRWCLTSLDDRQTGHRGCHGNCSSSWLVVAILCAPLSTEWKVYCDRERYKAQRPHEVWWADVFWLKAMCGLKLNNSYLDMKWTYKLLNKYYTVCDVWLWLQIDKIFFFF